MNIREVVTTIAVAMIRAANRHRDRDLSWRLHVLADRYDPSDHLDCRYTTDVPAVLDRVREGVMYLYGRG